MFHRIAGYCVLLVLWTGLLAGQDALVAGTYQGQWTGAAAGGDIHVTFRADGDGKLTPEVGFTLGGQDVTCKILSFKVDGARFTMVYEFDAQGNMLQSATEATVGNPCRNRSAPGNTGSHGVVPRSAKNLRKIAAMAASMLSRMDAAQALDSGDVQ